MWTTCQASPPSAFSCFRRTEAAYEAGRRAGQTILGRSHRRRGPSSPQKQSPCLLRRKRARGGLRGVRRGGAAPLARAQGASQQAQEVEGRPGQYGVGAGSKWAASFHYWVANTPLVSVRPPSRPHHGRPSGHSAGDPHPCSVVRPSLKGSFEFQGTGIGADLTSRARVPGPGRTHAKARHGLLRARGRDRESLTPRG